MSELEDAGSLHGSTFNFEEMEAELRGKLGSTREEDITGQIEQLCKELATVFLKRSNSLLKIRSFRRAMKDANEVLSLYPTNAEAFYYKIKAMFGLNMFTEVIQLIQDYKLKYDVPDDSDMHLMLSKLNENSKKYLHQQMTGEYDMAFFSTDNETKFHECAEYTGAVELVDIDTKKGRGFRATKEIKKGELVMVSKPLLILYDDDSRSTNHQQFQKFKYDEETFRNFCNLYGGPDIKFIPREAQITPDMLHPNIILKVWEMNHLELHPKPAYSFVPKQNTKRIRGIWYKPALINHSCWESNCHYNVYGSIMFIRAFKDIQIGEEILISYIDNIKTSHEDKAKTLGRFGFYCDCTLCQLENKESKQAHNARDQMNYNMFGLEQGLHRAVIMYIKKLKAISGGDRGLAFYLAQPYYDLGLAYSLCHNYELSAACMVKSYELIAGTAADDQFGLTILDKIIQGYLNTKDEKNIAKAQHWATVLKEASNSFFGGKDGEVLNSIASNTIEIYKSGGIQF